jgi:hypothetical protein
VRNIRAFYHEKRASGLVILEDVEEGKGEPRIDTEEHGSELREGAHVLQTRIALVPKRTACPGAAKQWHGFWLTKGRDHFNESKLRFNRRTSTRG